MKAQYLRLHAPRNVGGAPRRGPAGCRLVAALPGWSSHQTDAMADVPLVVLGRENATCRASNGGWQWNRSRHGRATLRARRPSPRAYQHSMW
jgi:hypothetical protein